MIIISPYSKPMRNGNMSAKNYPWWQELINLLPDKDIIQIGVDGERQLVSDFRKNMSFKDIEKLLIKCSYWISVDNFLQHMAHHIPKPGVVLWGVSNPLIFGYPENINILKDRNYLRNDQFDLWENVIYNYDVFVTPQIVIEQIDLNKLKLL